MSNEGAKIERIENWKEDALNDKGLFFVLKNSIFLVGSPIDNYLFFLVMFFGVSFCIYARLCLNALKKTAEMVLVAHDISAYGSGIAVAVLGFLITGFSVFATMMKPEYFRILARFRADGRPVSEFKFVMYNYLYIFAHYIIYLLVNFFIFCFFRNGSPLWFLGKLVYVYNSFFVDVFTSSSIVLLVSYTFL